MASNSRAAALARLAELGAPTAASATAEDDKVTRTGDEVYAGGDVARLLIRPAHLSYVEKGDRYYVRAKVGDTITVTEKEAKRLDAAGATVDPDTDVDEVNAIIGEGEGKTDEELEAMSAAELVAYVGQHPDQRDRVRDLEFARPEDKRRKTVLDAVADHPGAE